MSVQNKSLAIVGLGYVSSLGSGKEVFYDKIKDDLPSQKMENYDPDSFLPKRGLRYFSKATKMFCNLAFQCIHQNKIGDLIETNKDRVGLYDGTELSNIEDGFAFDLVARNEGPELVSPMNTPNTIANAAASQMAIQSKITGPNFSINGGTCSALQAIDVAALHLKDGITDCAIICSTETSSKYQEAIRFGEHRQSKLPLANEYGTSIALERTETALNHDQKIWGYITGTLSGQTLAQQSRENLIAVLIQEIIAQHALDIADVDLIMIGSGAHNISGQELKDQIGTTLGQSPDLCFPEIIYGNGDNAGGLASILYSVGLFNEDLEAVRGLFSDGNIDKKPTQVTIENSISVTIDKTGYSVITLLQKHN